MQQWCTENTEYTAYFSVCIPQKEMVNGADPEYVSEEEVAAAQKQLESINKSIEVNAG